MWRDSGLNQVVHKKAGRVKCGAAVHLLTVEATVALTKWFTKKLAG